MAGSEQIGLHGADPDLFEGAVWVLTPTAATDLGAFDRLKSVVMSLGADVLVLSASDHDRLVAMVSHVPHLVAATLMNTASAGAEQDAALLRLAAGGFRDMTHVAAGHPAIWPDICAENAMPDRGGVRCAGERPDAMRDHVATQDREALLGVAPEGEAAARRNLPARSFGPITSPSCGSRSPTGRACWPRSRRSPLTPASASTTSRSHTRPKGPGRAHPGHRRRPTPRG